MVKMQVDSGFDGAIETNGPLLVLVPIAGLNKTALADVALKELSSRVVPHVVPHVAELMCSQTALPADKQLSFAASNRVDDDIPVVVGLVIYFHVLI